MGRTCNHVPNRVVADTINIAGSLAGIVAFALASWLRTSPLVWFTIALAVCIFFVKRWTLLQIYAQMAVLFSDRALIIRGFITPGHHLRGRGVS